MDGVGVDERDLEAEEPLPRLRVDQLGALVRDEVQTLLADLEPESQASETVGTVRVVPVADASAAGGPRRTT